MADNWSMAVYSNHLARRMGVSMPYIIIYLLTTCTVDGVCVKVNRYEYTLVACV